MVAASESIRPLGHSGTTHIYCIKTGEQVYHGLTGMIILQEELSDRLPLQ